MKAIIVDDEPLARDGIRMLLAEHREIELVGEAGNGNDALELVARARPDLLLVDVQMPEMSGLELAARVLALDAEAPAVIFITAYDEFALRAFEVHALDYVLKPIDEHRFADAIRRARSHHELATARLHAALADFRRDAPSRLAIRGSEAVVFVPIDEIDWIEAADYYVEIHAGGRSYLHRETLQRLQTLLDERFVRIHRSRLVNRDRVAEIRWEPRGEMVVVTTSGVSLKVSRSCRAKLTRAVR